jgi:TolA-binding protein
MKTDNSKLHKFPTHAAHIASFGGLFVLALLAGCASTRSPDAVAGTTSVAANSAQIPESNTAAQSQTTAAQSQTTAAQSQTTAAQSQTTAAQSQTTAAQSQTTAAQSQTTAAQSQTTAAQSQTTAAQSQTTAAQVQPSAAALARGHTATPDLPKQPASDSEIALMRVEIMSLKEKMASVQRKLELVLKAQRSGLYEPENLDSIQAAVRGAEPKKNIVPPLGTDGPIDRFDTDFERAGHEKALLPESAQKIVDRALGELAQGDFARVAQSLEGFQQRFPSHPLSNSVELALAEAYVELKSPQQAIPHLRTFYLQHPNDVQLYRAKWLEARAQEQLQAPQRAAQLYREVIALSPQSDVALRSRAALERINGGTTQ